MVVFYQHFSYKKGVSLDYTREAACLGCSCKVTAKCSCQQRQLNRGWGTAVSLCTWLLTVAPLTAVGRSEPSELRLGFHVASVASAPGTSGAESLWVVAGGKREGYWTAQGNIGRIAF